VTKRLRDEETKRRRDGETKGQRDEVTRLHGNIPLPGGARGGFFETEIETSGYTENKKGRIFLRPFIDNKYY
jgi:hypothetical protein